MGSILDFFFLAGGIGRYVWRFVELSCIYIYIELPVEWDSHHHGCSAVYIQLSHCPTHCLALPTSTLPPGDTPATGTGLTVSDGDNPNPASDTGIA